MSDVTAVLLSLGEPYTERARASLQRQTCLPEEVVVVQDVRPFHRALNEGAAKVTTPFFVQVDADMVLDPDCLETLRACMTGWVGMAVGQVRDPMVGRVPGVRLYRTEVWRAIRFRDTISPDTEYRADMRRAGWWTVYALGGARTSAIAHTFADHLPEYTPSYTFSKYALLGQRYVRRQSLNGLIWHMRRLSENAHPAARWARVGLGHGAFQTDGKDRLGVNDADPEFAFLERFLDAASNRSRPPSRLSLLDLRPRAVFTRFYRQGIAFRRAGAGTSFETTTARLAGSRHPYAWLALLAFCRGAFTESYDRVHAGREYDKVQPLVQACRNGHRLPHLLRRWRRARANRIPG